MPDEKGGYEVGYKKPPKGTRFRKGRSGNLHGRPKEKEASAEAAGVLEEPVLVKQGGVPRRVPPFEAGVRRLVTRALKGGDLNAALEFLRLCEGFGLLEPPAGPQAGHVVTLPMERWDRAEERMREAFDSPPPPGLAEPAPNKGGM